MSFQAYLDSIEKKTGLTPRQIVGLAHEKGLDAPGVKAGTILAWLKDDFDLGRGHGMAWHGMAWHGMAMVHVITKGSRINIKHVGTSGSHADESDTLWLDGAATNPH